MNRVALVRDLGLVPLEPVWRRMQRFTDQRGAHTTDEIWFQQHPPVFTLGLNADRSHVLAAGDIPVLQIDRGGQVTYHGPGQLVVYPLLDMQRLGLGIRDLVTALEESVIAVLRDWGIHAVARADAPGVYVDGAKLASVGLRVRRGASYHGIAINVDNDLSPFQRINPCGFSDLAMTRIADLRDGETVDSVLPAYRRALLARLALDGVPAPAIDIMPEAAAQHV